MNHLLLKALGGRPQKDSELDFEETLKSIHPSLELHISKRARRLALRLDSTNHIMKLVVPLRFSRKKAEQFAYEHRHWIVQKLAELPSPIPFADGTTIPFLGQDRIINVLYDPSLKVTTVKLQENEILVKTNKDDPSARITRFLKAEARKTLTSLATEKAAAIDRPVKQIQIRDTKSRWGSCGPDARISFSWRLVLAPWEAMDYVVAHEIAHLVHMNHSKRFWSLCEKLSDDYHNGKQWMRRNGNELMRYG